MKGDGELTASEVLAKVISAVPLTKDEQAALREKLRG